MTKKEYQERYRALRDEISELRAKVMALNNEYSDSVLKFNGLEYGSIINVGGIEYKLERIEVEGWETPAVYGRRMKKDGTPSMRIEYIRHCDLRLEVDKGNV